MPLFTVSSADNPEELQHKHSQLRDSHSGNIIDHRQQFETILSLTDQATLFLALHFQTFKSCIQFKIFDFDIGQYG